MAQAHDEIRQDIIRAEDNETDYERFRKLLQGLDRQIIDDRKKDRGRKGNVHNQECQIAVEPLAQEFLFMQNKTQHNQDNNRNNTGEYL